MITRKYRIGFARVRVWIQAGILAIGVVKPERIIDGMINKNAPKSPCCIVTAKDEIINPTPIEDSKKKESPTYKVTM